jgi:hypothetical protein
VSFRERIRRLWRADPPPDHPLDARERDEDRPVSGQDERARVFESLAGDVFDPDDRRVRR